MATELQTLADSLVSRFEASASRHPDQVAVVDGRDRYTYRQVRDYSDRIARGLVRLGVEGTRVGLSLSRSFRVPIAILGVLKAGCSYVPLDPAYPEARVRFIAEDAEVSLVLTDERAEAPGLGCSMLTVEECVDRGPDAALPVVSASAEAYVIYTSGSTGEPKGVPITHGHVGALLRASERHFSFSSTDCWSLFHSYNFDFSVWELWGALAYGGRLVIIPKEATLSTELLLDVLVGNGVTVLNQVPSVLDHLVRRCRASGQFVAPRYLICGGERLDPGVIRQWMSLPQRAGHHVVNMYGITETTVHATYRRILASDVATDDARSPIGAPLEHVDIHVLDAHLRPVTEEPGELWISGAGVTAGYVNREDLNRERFRHLDSLGGIRAYRSGDRGIRLTRELVYLGRVDDQVKVRGYRIELGEVEAALRRHPSVRGAVAVVIPLAREELGLVALCTSAPGDPAADATELRRFVAGQVPRHVVPSHIFCVGELPLLPSGKADRAEAADMARRLFAASRSRT